MKKFLLFLFLLASPAFAQSVQQSGNVTANHLPYWVTSGVQGDGGSSADSPISSIGVTNNGGAGFCVSSARQSAAGRNQLCFGAQTSGPATISLQNYGTASAQPLNFVINGTTETPLFLGGAPVFGDIATFLNSNTIQDSGLAASAGVITGGSWQATPVGIPWGGTGANTASNARTNLGLGTMALQNANAVAITGGSATGLPTPVNASDVAIKSYVDSTASGLNILAQSRLATAAVLPNTPTYSNGSSGVGATLTAGTNSTLTVDGTVANINDVVLVKNQASAFQNGIYTVTTAGSGGAAWVLTRATYFNTAAQMKVGSYTFITAGSTNIDSSWTLQSTVVTVGTDALNFVQFSASTQTSIAGNTGNFTLTQPLTNETNALVLNATITPQGRCTLTTGTPITTTDVTGATTVYYTPTSGNLVPIYDGTNFIPTAFSEVSQATTDTTKSPAAVGASSVYDVFGWLDGSTFRATRGPAWSSDTSRGTGAGTSQITLVNGIWTNTNTITNGPAAGRGTLLCSIRSNASSQINDSKAFRWVSNIPQMCVQRQMAVVEPTASWNYSTATFRQANANPANQLDMLQTLAGQELIADVNVMYSNTNILTFGVVGIDIDAINTTTIVNNINLAPFIANAGGIVGDTAKYNGYPGLGRHTAIWKEYGIATGTGTFFGTSTGTVLQAGIYGNICN